MKNVSTKFALALGSLSILMLIFSSGCATMRANSARTAYIHQMTEKHVYNSPCAQVWPTARNLLFSEGYAVKNTGEGMVMTLETEWKYINANSSANTTSSSTVASRYLVQGMQPDEGQCQVNFSMNERSQNNNMDSRRDLELEWQLLQEVDPGAAAQIRQDAEVRANAAAQG